MTTIITAAAFVAALWAIGTYADAVTYRAKIRTRIRQVTW
jgi:hypothetical protein